MKAVVKFGQNPGETKLMDMPIPEIGVEDVLVKIECTGVCGTDPHMHNGTSAFDIQTPLIFGHEFAGIIDKVGANVKDWQIGQRVTAETHADYCGVCKLCRDNKYHLCKDRKGYGFQTHGAFSEYVKVPQRILHKVPDNIDLKYASLTEPLCVAYKSAFISSDIKPGDTVVVIGPGPIGILCAAMAKLAGASNIAIIGTEGDEGRLELSKQYGTTFQTTSKDELMEYVFAADSYGADLVIDTAGVSATLDLSLDLVCPCGQITKIGWGPKPVGFSLDRLLKKSATLKGHFSHTWDVWEKCIKLMSTGQIDLAPLVTHELPFEEWEKAFHMVESKEALKVVLHP